MALVSFRCDADTLALIASLAREGETRSDTIRRALHDAARLRQRDQMQAESRVLELD
ncbi:MAG: ribbon-helix-helix protein, CopG family [Propionibacteriaceae bacterium]|nr:ribbon-helix-helix protein, CopG family [Propionibacteriaceae bacterium]